ncbi:MAG: redoxin domain-containing protein [Eggerthellaceae bacterium]|nr:redoxin domain-containing protein [Eggerthellaceae bacterium]
MAEKKNNDASANRKIFIWIIVFVVLIILAGVAYTYFSGNTTASDLVAEPEMRDEATTETGDAVVGTSKGDIAPSFTATTTDGTTVSLADYIGKPIVINFWASWCTYCKQEMPELQSAYEQYGDEVTFLMVDTVGLSGETQSAGLSYIKSGGYTFPILFDDNYSATTAYGINSLPQTYFIDSNGIIAYKSIGLMNSASLEQGLSAITG